MGEQFQIHKTVSNITDRIEDHNDNISKTVTSIELNEIKKTVSDITDQNEDQNDDISKTTTNIELNEIKHIGKKKKPLGFYIPTF